MLMVVGWGRGVDGGGVGSGCLMVVGWGRGVDGGGVGSGC